MSTTAVIIQARMAARRLPGKVLKRIAGMTVLEHVVRRARAAERVERVIVATTVEPQDLAIVELMSSVGVSVFCGSETDVLDRYYQAARLFSVERIVRITADCPLIDPEIIDRVIQHAVKTQAEYCSNVLEETFPDGLDVEVVTFTALARAWREADLPSEREHVTAYIRKHPELFQLANVRSAVNAAEQRWTLDEERDEAFLRAVIEALYPTNPDFRMADVLALLRARPELATINAGIIRNAGYQKSLADDARVSRGQEMSS